MPRTLKLEQIQIPAASLRVKALFGTREQADAELPGIRRYIKETGETYTHPAHTHTKPPVGAMPVYIGEFELPERFKTAKRFQPCPCCCTDTPKFGHGYIAWFPAESVIRILGPDCFRALSPLGHQQAKDRLKLENEIRRNVDFLLSNLPKLPKLRDTFEIAAAAARATEVFHRDLHNKLKVARLGFAGYFKVDGALPVDVRRQEARRTKEGDIVTRWVTAYENKFRLSGYEMLGATLPQLSKPIEAALAVITPLAANLPTPDQIVAMPSADRQKLSDRLSGIVGRGKTAIIELERIRRFVEPISINTLRSWGAHEGCRMPAKYEHLGDKIRFGMDEFARQEVKIPASMRDRIPAIDFWGERASAVRFADVS